MIASIDGIDGPLNKIKYNGFFLINGYVLSDTPLNTLNMGFINYDSVSPMDGSKVPTLLRIKGINTAITGVTNFDSLTVFFDNLTPFFSNYHAGEIFCQSTDGVSMCKHYEGAKTLSSKYNYNTLSRIEIPLTTPGTPFNVFIPITFTAGQTNTNFYLGYQTIDPVTKLKSLAYI
jgi:hypothetical protein